MICLVSSSFAFAESRTQRADKFDVAESNIQNGFPNIFRPIGNLFKRIFGAKRIITEGGYANVTNLTLSRSEITSDCSAGENVRVNDMRIGIYAEGSDPENDPLIYVYKASGGKIIGEGNKVIWDLAGEKPGTYTITAGAADGCGICGYTKTQTIKIVECLDGKQ